jgi:hypothetical protein
MNLVLFTTLLGFSLQQPIQAKAPPSPAAPTSDEEMAQLLVGKWRLQYGNSVMETVYMSNGRFTSLSSDGVYPFYCAGRWTVRNGSIYAYFEDWQPRCTPMVDGSCTPIRMPEWEADPIQFLDNNRYQTQLGIFYRIG